MGGVPVDSVKLLLAKRAHGVGNEKASQSQRGPARDSKNDGWKKKGAFGETVDLAVWGTYLRGQKSRSPFVSYGMITID